MADRSDAANLHDKPGFPNCFSGSQGANFTVGVREREDANRTRAAGDWFW
jgi:hypothetical protein